MTASVEALFSVRCPVEFSVVGTAEEWLGVYKYTRDTPSLLGLLHGGAEFTDDPRVLDVYLTYCELPAPNIPSRDHDIKQKARSVFYHKMLNRLHLPSRPGFDPVFDFFSIRAEVLGEIFEFFAEPSSFPTDQPFYNNVMSFMHSYASYLPEAMASSPRKKEDQNLQDKMLRDLLQNVVWALISSLEVAGNYTRYYEGLLLKIAGHEVSRELVRSSVEARLTEDVSKIRKEVVVGPFLTQGIKLGGAARKKALLLYDIEKMGE